MLTDDFNTVKGPNRFRLIDFLVISGQCGYYLSPRVYFMCIIDCQVSNGNVIYINHFHS